MHQANSCQEEKLHFPQLSTFIYLNYKRAPNQAKQYTIYYEFIGILSFFGL